jgi:hypothetical protein
MSLMTGSNFFPSLFSLSISLQRYIRHPRDRGFDPVRLIVSYGPLVRTSFSVALKALAHDLRSPFGQFHAYEVNQRCTTKVCLGKQAGPLSNRKASVPSTHHTSLSFVALAGQAALQPCSALCCPTLRLRLRSEKFRT